MDAPIIVAGAGPVGTSLAIDAAMRGVDVVVLEAREANTPPDAKCNTIASRTMEVFRRFGIAQDVRAAGLPDDFPTDTVFASSVSGHEFTRIQMPSRRERQQPGEYFDSHWPTPEPMVRESQLWLEPILRQKLLSLPNVTFLPRTELESFSQDAESVTVTCRDLDSDTQFMVSGQYLVGCDGGGSRVRKGMGIRLTGDAEISRTRSALIRSTDVIKLFGERRPAWMTWVANHKARGTVVAIDGKELWLVHRALPNGTQEFESLDQDQSIRDVLGVDGTFDFQILRDEDWIGRRLVAPRFRNNRVFLAGDAAHVWVPFAGYGMNAGIADAVNLSWLLTSVIKGWAAPGILEAYEAERWPITHQVSKLAMTSMQKTLEALGRGKVPRLVSSSGALGKLLRTRLRHKLFPVTKAQMVPEGLNFGYYYTHSPIILNDGSTAPEYSMAEHVPSTVPGCRLPHFSVQGISILDLLGPDYTIISFDPGQELTPILSSKLPITMVQAKCPDQNLFKNQLYIVRQDSHIAWRGDRLPENLNLLVDTLCGIKVSSPKVQPTVSDFHSFSMPQVLPAQH